jgi:hypothetical protein
MAPANDTTARELPLIAEQTGGWPCAHVRGLQ